MPIYKKGDKQECGNYRTIALISHASKVLLRIIQRRLDVFLIPELLIEQAEPPRLFPARLTWPAYDDGRKRENSYA